MSGVPRCLSHLHHAWRCDKCSFSISLAGTSWLPGGVSLTSTHPPSSMDDSLTATDTPTSNDCETLIQAAVSAVHAGNLSFHAAGRQFGIHPTTISNRFHGRQAPSVTHEHQQLLSNTHKEVIIEWARWHGDMAD